ncbi:glycosyltransferase [Brumimicrobium oceani]|uniref:glycosyltransferase n=1 Tax=Brumimicrobium oceani TaxID=2100725 RepID=UPI0011B1FBF2|nr:glycosyltransferase [Brumimicrobium oceani]
MSPLNWGLGHVSRTVPIIQWLLANENEVIICCDESQERFYRNYFPEIWYVPHAGYPFEFNGKGNWTLDILKNFSSLHLFLQEENRIMKQLVEKFNPDLIISDQRFGFVSKQVKSIIISHQLNLPVPKWNVFAKMWNRKLLSAFNEIWIPDNISQEYSGKLSNGKLKNKHFIGTCSRFKKTAIENSTSIKAEFEYLGIISGPLPYSKQLLDLFIKKMTQSNQKAAVIVPEEIFDTSLNSAIITAIPSPSHTEFINLLLKSKTVISRAGYSTLMDLIATKNKGILIPTPGQSEQIYLSKLHKEHPLWTFKTEEEFLQMDL